MYGITLTKKLRNLNAKLIQQTSCNLHTLIFPQVPIQLLEDFYSVVVVSRSTELQKNCSELREYLMQNGFGQEVASKFMMHRICGETFWK